MRDLGDCMHCNSVDWAMSWVIIVSLHKPEVPWCGGEAASCEVLCFNKSQRFVRTVGMLSVYLQSQHLGSWPGPPAGPVQDSAGDVQIHRERGPGSTVFLWVETKGFKGYAQSFGAVGSQNKNWKLLVYFLQHGFHLCLTAAYTNLIFSLQDTKKLVSSPLLRSCRWSACWHVLINFCYFSLGKW